MTKIIVLDEFTANQIAAGEVVERPVSAVKEIVENSIDAGAGRITVELEEGGLAGICVTDDGCGMEEEDLLLAFHRHATSKIKSALDLAGITSLGFRGEALPSVAAVSRMAVTTRTRESLTGARAEVAGGSLTAVTPAGCPPGTVVVVKDLFYNTPARRKTMRSPSAEASMCGELISRLALARPEVSFELRINGRRVFYSPGSGSLFDAVAAVYGVRLMRDMVAVSAAKEGLAVKGYAGKPSLSRSTRNQITVIVNGRYVHCPAVAEAVEEAYRTLLPHGRKPVALLSLSILPAMLDINIHPAKLDVRLLEEDKVTGFVTGALKEALMVRAVIPSKIITGRKGNGDGLVESQVKFDYKPVPLMVISEDNSGYLEEKKPEKEAESSIEKKTLPDLNVLVQLFPTYILASGEDGLYIIDQHAAHERVLYEEFLSATGERPSQCLLIPVTLELDYREAVVVTERVLWFSDAGFILEHFGGNTFLLRGMPPHFPAGQEKDLFLDLLDYFRERGPSASRVEFNNMLASALACRSAVKSGDKLSYSEMDKLLERLAATENPYTCPHGRPTLIHLSYHDLEARFKR